MAEQGSREIRGLHMDRDEVDAFLADQGYGVLSLADGGSAYGVPVSFGYDGESKLYLYLIQFGDDSRKLDYADETETACVVTFDVESRFRWRSAIVSGPLHTLPEDEVETMEEVMNDNAWFPSLFPPEDPMTAVRRLELRVEEVTGRKGEEYQ
ncbi:MAG: pyridoxamine 5'-phosphate oxidase family protein [Actinobacteria bacterium]|nr:pyridoxamine 5'-phosphate oxidase family protein [Actinomycetota bacterium]NIU67258.1 pyridoxamine 5'-phosphate oxidase family protein [Actinomycetota bacterium]NIW29040.1 pyridoxamine 5'-phosphate oxidase family protein [Actinomycetota bacterium]NIX21542.1 pyridoxamine 5'-phosphate oxidase family protein [Actinomycetota bacterium]